MKKFRVEICVKAEQESLANYHMSWDVFLREEFEKKGNGVWHSGGEYLVGYDDEVAEQLKEFADERMREYGITEFHSEIVEYEN